jgi:hypothetical protein
MASTFPEGYVNRDPFISGTCHGRWFSVVPDGSLCFRFGSGRPRCWFGREAEGTLRLV